MRVDSDDVCIRVEVTSHMVMAPPMWWEGGEVGAARCPMNAAYARGMAGDSVEVPGIPAPGGARTATK